MSNDSYFKANCHIEGFEKHKYSKEYSKWYRPDLVLEKVKDEDDDSDSRDEVIIVESSTTGDRKPHIAEVIQFITHIKNDKTKNRKYYYMLFIPQKEESESPKVKIEAERIKYYYEEMAPDDVKNRVEGIYVIDENVVNIEKLTLDVLENWRVI